MLNTVEVLENRMNGMESRMNDMKEEIKELKSEKRELVIYVKGLERELENVIEYLYEKQNENC